LVRDSIGECCEINNFFPSLTTSIFYLDRLVTTIPLQLEYPLELVEWSTDDKYLFGKLMKGEVPQEVDVRTTSLKFKIINKGVTMKYVNIFENEDFIVIYIVKILWI